ncbi:uncharacterized protein LOC130294310 [Hyla sarda]|uniref:uncharacterized protein LOC130294310 n=1 Tax=Hyla sarda TaxID=327740 RepID=UPI0024C23510|nr:uncharacterized protein LOC130294310 [Hyla sarda]
MRVLLLVCVQTVLMASGTNVRCITCSFSSEERPKDCYGISLKCGMNQVCLTLHMSTFNIPDSRLIRINTYIVRRLCWDAVHCGYSGKLSSPSHKMIFNTNCCSTDNCRMPIPGLPPENNTHNGLVCPATTSFLEMKYKPTSAMKCTGDETYCFEFTNDRYSKQYIIGCASFSYCVIRLLIGEFYHDDPNSLFAQTSCSKANRTSYLPVVNSLLCWQCRGSANQKCEQYAMCSATNDVCVTILSKKITYGVNSKMQLLRRCGFSSECNIAGIITTAQKSISKNTTCCYTDHCISPMPTLPTENEETNGHICESCYLKEYGRCSGEDHIACTGNATQCISYTEQVTDGNFTSREVLHGCTHPSICDGGNIKVTYDHKIIQETKICKISSKSSKYFPNILSAFVIFMVWSMLM